MTEDQFPEPWIAIGKFGPKLVDELVREVGPDHLLWRIRAEAVAQRTDSDDVLFAIDSELGSHAVVHLTWSGHAEVEAWLPDTQIFTDLQAWIDSDTFYGEEE